MYLAGTLKFYVDEYNKGYVSVEALVAALKELFNTQAKVFGLKLCLSPVWELCANFIALGRRKNKVNYRYCCNIFNPDYYLPKSHHQKLLHCSEFTQIALIRVFLYFYAGKIAWQWGFICKCAQIVYHHGLFDIILSVCLQFQMFHELRSLIHPRDLDKYDKLILKYEVHYLKVSANNLL